ncbi:MAG: BadF/BadG/BcrA/BcrD type ATPase [Chloroflexi bacterium]|nr:BadF/BadG/BcrA/BcrD type ATPase [Chloroflexota bacterium]
MNELVIGIDGGGSRTRACLANLRGEMLGTGEAGTSNPFGGGLDAAKRELAQAVQQAFDAAQIEPQRVAAACLGLGGAGRSREQEELVKWAREMMADRVRVVNDGEIALAAATSENWGVAVIAGTGSLAWGRNRAGQTARAGGWGYILGDEGSGFDLARRALRAITQAADNRAEPTELRDAVLRFLNLSSPTELVVYIYGQPLKPAEISRLAPLVIVVAGQGDRVAQRLVQQAGEALALAVNAVSRALDMTQAIPLALTGGLLLGAPLLRAHVIDALGAQGCEYAPVIVVDQPVLGAVRLAQELALRESI